MAFKYLSKEWEAEMNKRLREEFNKPGNMNTTFAQIIEDIPGEENHYVLATLEKSMVAGYEVGLEDDMPDDILFKVYGDYSVYKGIIEGKIDGSKCLMTGQLSLEGNMVKAVATIGTYKRLEKVLQSVDTEFHG